MKAVCWQGPRRVAVEEVPEPVLLNDRDIIVKVARTAICGSDLHLYHGHVPAMMRGDILGHEFMGEVAEVGKAVRGLNRGDRVVVPFVVACGRCWQCRNGAWALCDNSNPNASRAATAFGAAPAGLFGYSHLYGGYAGGQAEYVRVPYGDTGPLKVPEGMADEQALFLSDAFPTGYMAAENCGIKPGDTVAVWGCGAVGQFAIKSASLLGAGKVIAIDNHPERLWMAQSHSGALPLNHDRGDVLATLKEMTGGRGPDACIDAVGMEARGHALAAAYDWARQAARLEPERPHVLGQAIRACRKGGTVSIAGVYGGYLDRLPMGAAFAKGLTLKMGPTHAHRYLKPLLKLVEEGKVDPSFVVTHRLPLDEAPAGYALFDGKGDDCVKVVLRP